MLKKSLLLVMLVLMTGRILAQEENHISLYLFNFTRYIEWPEEKRSGKFVIEVLGHESVYEKLKERLNGKKINSQSVEIRNYMDAGETGKPHIMFVGHWQSDQMPEVLEKLNDHPTLIVTEKKGMIDEGAAINFLVQKGKIEYEYKKSHASERGLKVNSRLGELGITID
ncbi:MAG: YfiR family protein [Marinilabilia sp.]